MRAITGVDGPEGETVSVVGVRSWVSPGIAADSVFIPRPVVELPPASDNALTGAPDKGADPDDVVAFERAPAAETDVVEVVVVTDDFVGVTVLDVPEFSTVVSLV